MSITVLNPGLMTTVQDMGRVGYQQFGVSVSGVMDPRSAAIANILVGNPEDEAVLECTMMGPQLLFNQAETIAITGGNLMPTLDGQPMPTYRAVTVQAGQVLRFQAPKTGCRCFIAFTGGLDIPEVMGSRSTYMKAKIGGFQGRKLEKGDQILQGVQMLSRLVRAEKAILVDENLADGDAMAYELDRTEEMWSLADYVEKGIEVLDNDNGFFMMCEGGKIDWACHANDAASSIHDTMALADAVQVAMDFAQDHADETLILVTGDHETGGLTIGFAGTDYDTYLNLLESQKISFAKFDSDYVAKYKENKTSFDEVMADVTELFGLKTSGEEGDKLVLTDYELGLLKTAYEKSINEKDTGMDEQQEYVLYGTYEPLTVTITHIINNKSGVSFTSYSHTGLPVAVLAHGVNAGQFNGYYDNTQIYHKLAGMLGIA